MDLFYICTVLSCLLLLCVVLAVILLYVTTTRRPDMYRSESERVYVNPRTGESEPFPSLYDHASVSLSVIVPSYNEELRLPSMLDEAVSVLEDREKTDPTFTYEFIIVDDGSSDRTTKVALEYSKQYGSDKVRVLTFEKNRGKGGAVRMGMLSARGRRLLFADADGASKFSDLEKLERAVVAITHEKKTDLAVGCGSRAHLEEESIAQRSLVRTVLMHGFHLLVRVLCVRDVRDTQCGFKLFTRPAARILFTNMHVNRWAFDVDLLYLAEYYRIPCAEVAITWHEIDGSKIIPFFSWAQMGKDLFMIRLRYMFGAWSIDSLEKVK